MQFWISYKQNSITIFIIDIIVSDEDRIIWAILKHT